MIQSARRVMVLAAALVTLALAPEAPAVAADAIVLSEAESGTAVTLSRDQSLEIRLATQSGTGFSWGAVALGGMRLWGIDVEEDATQPGGTETQVFRFQPVAAGSGEIVLDYRQPWVRDQPPERTFTVTVTVDE